MGRSHAPHIQAIERARRAFEADERVLALWLEGSMSRGTADAGSDVDLHLAVADDAFDAFVASPVDVIELAGRPLGYLVVSVPRGRIFPAAVAGPARVDLYMEQRGGIAATSREPGQRMLFDRDGVERNLEASSACRRTRPRFCGS